MTEELEKRIADIEKVLTAHHNLLNLVDQFLVAQKTYFDQVKINSAPQEKPAEKPVVEEPK